MGSFWKQRLYLVALPMMGTALLANSHMLIWVVSYRITNQPYDQLIQKLSSNLSAFESTTEVATASATA